MNRANVSFTFLDRVTEVELNVRDGRWQSALALALTLPDICGGIAFPDIVKRYRDGRIILDRQKNPTRDVGAQYIRWFDEFAGDFLRFHQRIRHLIFAEKDAGSFAANIFIKIKDSLMMKTAAISIFIWELIVVRQYVSWISRKSRMEMYGLILNSFVSECAGRPEATMKLHTRKRISAFIIRRYWTLSRQDREQEQILCSRFCVRIQGMQEDCQ